MARRKPYLVGHQEFAALYCVDPKQVAQWLAPSRGVLAPTSKATARIMRSRAGRAERASPCDRYS
ncbi:hypothetical protein Shyhy02_09460 [Streptomyces hygroscopicus subsp. hygroscopicus]|nr:hypothetical protein Shyhy02_09460 [Streptomyces hygroscopicus subsp. hygroscopicus]